jgi:hypothetical protein
MTDLFERQLSEALHAQALPEDVPDLGPRSVRLGQRMRRRRIATIAAAVVLLLIVPGAARTWLQTPKSDAPPVTNTAAPQQSGPKIVNLDPVGRSTGDPPAVSIVRDLTIEQSSGDIVLLPEDQLGTVAEYKSGFAWLTRSGGELRLNLSTQALPVAGDDPDVEGVEPGPGGSVMVRTKSGPVLWTLDGTLVVPDSPALQTDRMSATANAFWAESKGRVVRTDASNLGGDLPAGAAHPQWRKVVVGDPQSDRVVVTDDLGCQVVVDGSTSKEVWKSCDWELNAFSSDGRFAGGRHRAATLGVVDLLSGEWLLAVDTEHNPYADRLSVDGAGRLSIVVGNADVLFGVGTCDLSAECSMAPWTGYTRLEFVRPNR